MSAVRTDLTVLQSDDLNIRKMAASQVVDWTCQTLVLKVFKKSF